MERIGDEYGISVKNLGVFRNESYFDRTGKYGNYSYEHNDWSRWIINSSHGFTKQGLEKISESIRAYSYLILSSQASARHGILGDTAPSLVAQRLFYDNLQDVVNKAVSLEDDIVRYQSTLRYARSTLDYSVGVGLYMLPSDMLLKSLNQVIEGFNDKLVVNTSGLELGKHVDRLAAVKAKPSQQQATLKRRPHTLDDHRDEVQALVLSLTFFAIWWVH